MTRPFPLLLFAMWVTAGCGATSGPVRESTATLDASFPAIHGRVVRVVDGEPIVAANLVLLGTRDGTMTDSLGEFRFALVDTGRYVIGAFQIGYRNRFDTLDVRVPREHRITIELEEIPADADPVIEPLLAEPRK
ncbi:MAG TPA: carboxypeptidase regulatory-like domain-containing protein [Candidatus Polarisedimenticolaceae bacterium]|nr:carboxypeptidase regulatory-like domain-containing protein [Candidatus Polarisedimenticolaceae bacterium]